jgi:alanine racemase
MKNEPIQRAWVEIDRSALVTNVKALKSILARQTDLMAVIKADAYGHGALKVAETVLEAGAKWLAIATLAEGIQLREAGIIAPILILGATNTPEEAEAIDRYDLQPTIFSPQQALVFSDTLGKLSQRSSENLPIHLKLDTGMSRLGTNWQEAAEFASFVHKLPNLTLASIYSHLATADEQDTTILRRQQERFQQAIGAIEDCGIPIPLIHLANSAGTLVDAHSRSLHYDLVRVGLALYGLYPAEHLRSVIKLQPVLQVKARVTQVKSIKAGTGVSYGYKYIAEQDLRLAVVSIGYADGVPRNLSNNLQVIVRGQLVPQIGAITMDQIMLDVSSIPNLRVGEIITLLGKDGDREITADDWAAKLGTISWEILCGFKQRLPRVYLDRVPEDLCQNLQESPFG